VVFFCLMEILSRYVGFIINQMAIYPYDALAQNAAPADAA